MNSSASDSVLLNYPPVQQRTGKLRALLAVLLSAAAAVLICSAVQPSGHDTGAFLAPMRPPVMAPRVPASQMADFPWEEGFKWPWEKQGLKKEEPAVAVESPEESPEEQPPAPESDGKRTGEPQMRASPPQMMADFPWEEGFKWPWEKQELKKEEPAVAVESPEESPEEQPPAPEQTD